MRLEKKYEIQSKQLLEELDKNERLQTKIKRLEIQLEAEKNKNKKLCETIGELKEIRDKWIKDHEEFDKMKAEYKILLSQLRLLRKKMFK